VVVVATPQELVGMIVEKAVRMADMMKIPVLALVENMSYMVCPDCGKKMTPFGESRRMPSRRSTASAVSRACPSIRSWPPPATRAPSSCSTGRGWTAS
jgi:tRNA(Ile2) C34 agmatinyltransferase TiaS